jgi:hypothetical protein
MSAVEQLDRKPGVWLDGVGYKYKCSMRGCEAVASGYHDISITGIGDFIFHCNDPDHDRITGEAAQEIDEQRELGRILSNERRIAIAGGALPQEEM